MEWRLYPLMAERKIRTATELQRKLLEIGIEISSAQLSRMLTSSPKRVSSDVMFGLTTVLHCTAADLWRNPNQPLHEIQPLPEDASSVAEGEEASSSGSDAKTSPPRRRRARKPDEELEVGPPMGVFKIKEQ